MNNDHDTGTDNNSFVIGQALSGRHLLDSPMEAAGYQGLSLTHILLDRLRL
jgi:hypothetical protein